MRLTGIETALLAYLVSRPHEVVGRDELLFHVWEAHGDLVTRAVDQAMRRLRSKIKDDARKPRHLVTVYGRGYRFDPAAGELASASANAAADVVDSSPTTGNIGPHPTRFFGREEEQRLLRESFAGGAVAAVLMGPGGIGKTRLARRFARNVMHEYPGGVWLVDLADCRGDSDVATRIAAALEVQLRSNAAPEAALGQIGRALRAREGALVVLDNAEDAHTAVERALCLLRAAAESVRWLVTTRVRLDVDATCWTLEPLSADAAASLFADRASALRRDFDASGQSDGVRRVVERLDHIPLAIELAAARARLLPPTELLARLDEGLSTLGRSREGPMRHATMRAAIASSWEALNDDEQLAARALASMRGTFAVRAAEALLRAVWEDHGTRLEGGLDLLDALLDASWIHPALDVGSEGRLAMYAVVREFAEEQEGRASREVLWRLHAKTVLAAARERVDQARGPTEREALDALTLDEGNLAVVERRFIALEPILALTALRSRLALAWRTGRVEAAAAGLERVVAGGRLEPSAHSSALATLGRARLLQLDPKAALGVLEEALDAGLDENRARTLEGLARARAQTGDVAGALTALDDAEKTAIAADDRDTTGLVRCFRGRLLGYLGEMSRSEAELLAAAEAFDKGGRPSGVGEALGYLGTIQASALRGTEALPHLERASLLLAEAGETRVSLVFNNALAVLLHDRCRYAEARALLDRICAEAASQGALDPLVIAYAHRMMLAIEEGRHDDAEADLSAAEEAFSGIEGHYFAPNFTWLGALLARSRGRLANAADRAAEHLDELQGMGGGREGGAALALLGAIAADADRVEEAEWALTEAQARLEELQDLRRLAAWPLRHIHLDLARARLAPDADSASTHRANSRERRRQARTDAIGDAPALDSSAIARLALADLEASLGSDGNVKLRPSQAVADRVCRAILKVRDQDAI